MPQSGVQPDACIHLQQTQRYYCRKEIEIRPWYRCSEPVSIHVRWLSEPARNASTICGLEYYQKAIEHIKQKVGAPKFFVFSDYPEHLDCLTSGLESFEVVRVNNGRQDMAYADMWLMTLCRHHIFKDSTFGWWAAWLRRSQGQIVCTNMSSCLQPQGTEH